MVEAMVSGLLQTFSWPAFGLMLLGVPVGLILGAIPGLGGNLGLALTIPFTFGMSPVAGFALLLGLHSVVQTGGPIPSILFNAPGTGPAAATCLDGFPLAQQGKAGRAIGAALAASAVGGLLGALGMAALLPVVRPVVLSFGPPEFFMLAVLGITFISLISGESLIKGLIIGGLGLMMSFVGMDPQTGVLRYAFGQVYLWDGVPLVAVVVGLFAGAEAMELIVKRGTIAQVETKVGHDVFEGVKDVFRHWWLTVRCSLMGYVIGVIPGLGGDVASWVSYGHARQTSKRPEQFGKGAIEGVIAPESANNSKEGGALIPTVVFGVPGSSGMAILLGAFLILGLTPGPPMIKDHLDLVWAMVWILAIANVIGAAGFLAIAKYLTLLTVLRASLLVPVILVFVMVGSFLTTNHLGDLVVTLLMTLVGYAMKKNGYPRAPLILGLILGELAETNLHISMRIWSLGFLARPITLVLLGLTLISIIYPVWQSWRKREERATAA